MCFSAVVVRFMTRINSRLHRGTRFRKYAHIADDNDRIIEKTHVSKFYPHQINAIYILFLKDPVKVNSPRNKCFEIYD